MRLVADWTLVDGTVHRRAALLLDEQGVVRAVGRAAANERPPPSLRDAIVVPGGIDACALTALLAVEGAAPAHPAEALRALAALACDEDLAVLRRRAQGVFAAAVRAGITTVALPHLAPQDELHPAELPAGDGVTAATDGVSASTRPRFRVAAALVAAASAVGIRLTLLDAVALRGAAATPAQARAAPLGPARADPWHRCSHPGLEAAVQHLDALVRYLLEHRTAKLSWGLLLPRPSLLGADALIGLRLRLGHLPTVIVDAGERFVETARTAQVPGVAAPTLAGQCVGGGGLDACCSWLPLTSVAPDPAAAAALANLGVATLQPPGGVHAGGAAPARPAAGHAAAADYGTASAHPFSGYDPIAWTAGLLRPAAPTTAQATSPAGKARSGLPPARLAANALGLRGGTLRPDTWADYAVLRAAPGARLPDTLVGVTRALSGAPGATPLRVVEVFVAGTSVFRAAPTA